MINFYYDPKYKYTNRNIIDVSSDNSYRPIDYANIDSPDSINGHIIYVLAAGEKIPTYLVDTDTGHRWFVSGITPISSRKKYQISLLRDLISENVELWKSENDCYISAGLATDYNKYKRWDLPYTNTKVNQQKLTINGKPSFFVYYVNTQHINDNVLTEDDLKISSSSVPGITGYDYRLANLNEIPNYNFVGGGNITTFENTKGVIKAIANNNYRYYWTFDSSVSANNNFNIGTGVSGDTSNSIYFDMYYIRFGNNEENCRTLTRNAVANFLNTYQSNNFGYVTSTINTNALDAYVDKIIYNTTDNKVYTIRKTAQIINHNTLLTNAQTTTLHSDFRNIKYPTSSTQKYLNPTQNGNWFSFQSTQKVHNYTLVELGTATSFDFNFIANQRKLPRSAVRCVNIVSGENGITNDDIAQSLMLAQTNGINSTGDTGRILDIQYLPFSVATQTNDNIKINNLPMIAQFLDTDDYEYVTDLPDLTNINKETDTIKIVSPSRSSQFLFRPYNNDGIMLFNTKITLKPYNSVIYVRPSTQGLLLQDFNDKDCLMIIEDFSLTNVSSEWTNYIYQNKNYSNIFDRQIQGREFERSWERQIENAQKLADSWSARNLSATKARTYTGNIPIISSIAGALGALTEDQGYMRAAQLDREYNEALYQEGLSLSRDLFNYQMDNIKSQPNIPSKITTIDSKFLDGVYLEYYSTNDTELTAISNYYRYNGNRVDAYGSFAQYWGWYVRGKIIKSNHYTQPELDELNKRLEMGIFTEVNYGN